MLSTFISETPMTVEPFSSPLKPIQMFIFHTNIHLQELRTSRFSHTLLT